MDCANGRHSIYIAACVFIVDIRLPASNEGEQIQDANAGAGTEQTAGIIFRNC